MKDTTCSILMKQLRNWRWICWERPKDESSAI